MSPEIRYTGIVIQVESELDFSVVRPLKPIPWLREEIIFSASFARAPSEVAKLRPGVMLNFSVRSTVVGLVVSDWYVEDP